MMEKCVTTAPSPSCGGDARGCDGEGAVVTQFPGKQLEGVKVSAGNHMPHWTMNGVIYHICFRLIDSVPRAQQQIWMEARKKLAQKQLAGVELTEEEIKEFKYLYSDRIESFLDSGYGSCLLRNDGALAVVQQVLRHDDGQAYRLHAYGVMPNHIHVIVEVPRADDMKGILQAWKSVSGHRLNRLLKRKGELWQVDSYNHIIRTRKEYDFQMNYVYAKNKGVFSWRLGVGNCVTTAPSPSCGGGAHGYDGEGAVVTQKGQIGVNDTMAGPILSSRKGITL